MKNLLVVALLSAALLGCRPTKVEQVDIYAQCLTIKEDFQHDISNLKQEIAEKDRKINALLRKVESSGVSITK